MDVFQNVIQTYDLNIYTGQYNVIEGGSIEVVLLLLYVDQRSQGSLMIAVVLC